MIGDRSKRSSQQRPLLPSFYGILVLACLLQAGCSEPPQTSSSSESQSSSRSEPSQAAAVELLKQVRTVYAKAKSYTDNSTVVFYAVPRATGTELRVPFTESYLAFERPNLLHVAYTKNIASAEEEAYVVVSDGLIVRSSAAEVADQIHEAIAPVRLSTKNFIPEPALRGAILENSIENCLPQLAMLLSENVEQKIFPGADRLRLGTDGEIDGKSFHRLEWSSPAGKRVLWIDPEQFFIRRMEIPIESQRKLLNPRNEYTNVSVWIDFEGVEIDADIDAQVFQLAVPDGARRVRRFLPPPPAGPPEALGKPVGAFEFKTLEGDLVTPDSLQGKVTILDFWTTQCPPCRAQAPVLNEVYQHFSDSEEFEFLAVSLDSRVVPNEVVAKTLASWGGEMPIVRDRNSDSVSSLNIRQTPSLLVLDRDGRLQSFQIGAHRTAEPLIQMIQRMLDGENLVATDRAKHAEFVAKYEAALDAAEIRDSLDGDGTVEPEVGERQLPEQFQLTRLWETSSEQLPQPRDPRVLVHQSWGPGARMIALEGAEAIVELDPSTGEVLERHALPDHPERTGGFLRTWTNKQGETWTLASGAGWQQVYVFDNDWQQVLAFPDDQHSGIGDVLFDDLTGSGTPVMYVGYWGGRGVQGGMLEGRMLWSNRRLDHVLQLGVGPQVAAAEDATTERRAMLATSTRGTVLQMGSDGKLIRERYVPGQAVMYFASLPDSSAHCGLSVGRAGEYTAVGFDGSDELLWEYELPRGEYVEPLQRIQSVELPDGSAAWLVVAANGSLHWLDSAGELLDRFDYGAVVTGAAMHRLGDQTLLFVSTAESLTAWQLEGSIAKSADALSVDSSESTQSDDGPSDER